MSGGDQFNPPGRVLFRIPFNVDAASAADFTRLIEDVVQRLRNLIRHPRHFGRGTTALPCPQAAQRTWFIIELQSRDREITTYSVPVFIEAETIYLRGYQNQHGEVFEFQRKSPGDNLPPPGPYLGGTSRDLSFSCNYEDLEPSTQKQGRNPDLGLALLPLPDPGREPQQAGSSKNKDKKKEVPRPNFGRERLKVAVRELAEGRNLHGQSQHRTAQNLLLVIIRFNESIRFRSICDAMAGLWTVQSSTGQPSRCLNKDCFGQIKNWNKLAINLQDSARRLLIWPSNLAEETGVRSAAEAHEILVLVLFHEDGNEPNRPEWIPPPDNFNNNNRRRHGGPGGGAAGGMGVYAAELPVPRWLPMPQAPVLEISAIHVLFRQDLTGVYGTVTVNNGLGAQQIFRRRKDQYQRYLGYSKMTLPLSVRDRSFSAADSWGIFLDLWNAATDAPVSTGRITWSICDFSSNIYDRAMTKTIGQAVVEYVVHCSATEDDNDVVIDNDDGITFELLGPAGSSRRPADYFRYGMVDGTGTTPGTSSSAGQPHEHDDLRRRRRR